tara:strand:- start:539 stop:811 length:273 start_codon:yes stop_codon:yes gene_type:complete
MELFERVNFGAQDVDILRLYGILEIDVRGSREERVDEGDLGSALDKLGVHILRRDSTRESLVSEGYLGQDDDGFFVGVDEKVMYRQNYVD